MHLSRLHANDAASNDLFAQVDGLRRRGYEVFIHSQSKPESLNARIISFEAAKEIARDPESIVLFHYCGFDKQLRTLREVARGRFMIRYQNVTPPKWFIPYSWRGFLHAGLGRMQIRSFLRRAKVDALLPASKFTAAEVLAGLEPTPTLPVFVIPVLANYDAFKQIATLRKPANHSHKTAIFVSRLLPHKGLHHLIELLHAWNVSIPKNIPQLRIQIIGKLSPDYEPYLQRLKRQAARLDVGSQVTFHTDVSPEELLEFYKSADVYICSSEHEGFGVPLIDAQSAGIPVIAVDYAAVAETVGEGGIIVGSHPLNYETFARAIASVVGNDSAAQALVERGFQNLMRFDTETILNSLVQSFSKST